MTTPPHEALLGLGQYTGGETGLVPQSLGLFDSLTTSYYFFLRTVVVALLVFLYAMRAGRFARVMDGVY